MTREEKLAKQRERERRRRTDPQVGAAAAARARAWREKNKETLFTYGRAAQMKHRFGITLEDYAAMHDQQNGRCAICRKPETAKKGGKVYMLCIDHCHKTGEIRGLLCRKCNSGIGLLKDDPKLIQSALDYLLAAER